MSRHDHPRVPRTTHGVAAIAAPPVRQRVGNAATADGGQGALGRAEALLVARARCEVLVVAALVVVGVLLRYPHLWTDPRLTDEWQDFQQSLFIAQGRELPLTNTFSPYIGNRWNYLLAGA